MTSSTIANNRLSNTFSAVIFDMDGTMFDTEIVAQRGMMRACKDCGYDMTEAIYAGTLGLPEPGWRAHLIDVFGDTFPIDEVAVNARQLIRADMAANGVPLKTGLLEMLDWLDELQIPRAIASSSKRATIEGHLEHTGLIERIHALVGGDEISKGKPAPDIFIEAARRLAIDPAHCIVFEDSAAGIRGAHAAGTIPIMIPDLLPPTDEVRALARVVLPSLHAARDYMRGDLEWVPFTRQTGPATPVPPPPTPSDAPSTAL